MPSSRPVTTTAPPAPPVPGEPAAIKARRPWRKALALASGGLLTAAGLAAGGVWYAAERVPAFYRDALTDVPPPGKRAAAADAFAAKTAELAESLARDPAPATAAAAAVRTWEQRFTQTQINAWLAERLPERYGDKIPDSVSDPRVDLSEPGLIRLGFRLTNSKFDGVVSLAVRPEITGPNRLSLAVEGLFAGVLPLDAAQFAPQVSAQLNKYGVRHRWEDGGDDAPPTLAVAVVPQGAGSPVLDEFEVDDDGVRVAGRRGARTLVTSR